MSHPEQMQFVAETKALFTSFFRGTNVLEIGSLNINGTVREFFDGCDYTGLDVVAGPGVDVVCPAHFFKANGLYDVVISCESLEHDMFWRDTLQHSADLLRTGGLLIITCAAVMREEHGTRRTSPEDSGTSQLEPWADYYKNLSRKDIIIALNADTRFDYLIRLARGEQDLQFRGVKRG